jgi:hypothetical protein
LIEERSMIDRILTFVLFTTLMSTSPSALAEKLVREFAGSRSLYTADFQVNNPWLIDWSVNSHNPRKMDISVTLINVKTDSHAGSVVQTTREGDGLRLMNESGVFRFRVDAEETYWAIKVFQLNREEAKQYTPRH